LSSAALVETGYYVSRTASSDHLVIDGGAHGYQNGGHAHADALSLTFSVRGVPLLIDPGTGGYTVDRVLRDRFRSTALHNTLTLDDRPQSVTNGPFHWSHTANSLVRCWRTNQGFDYFDGAHDGYQPVAHRRHLLALHDDLLIVADLVDGPGTHTAAAHWHIDPRWRTDVRGRRATFTYGGEAVSLVATEGVLESFSADANTGLGWHSPVYGRVERATTLRVTCRGTTPLWMVSVFALHAENAIADVSDAGPTAEAIAIRISRADSTDYLLIAEPATNPDTDATRGTRRIGDLETDARMLFYSSTPQRAVSRLALVDGSIVRAAGRRGFHLDLHSVVPDHFADFDAGDKGRTRNPEPRTKDQERCVASPAS
jgi:heparinase II/III-like protein